MLNNLIKRIITGIILVLLVFGMTLTNRFYLLIGLLVFSNIAIYEMSNALSKIHYAPNKYLAYFINTLILCLGYLIDLQFIVPIMSIYIVLLLMILIFSKEGSMHSLFGNAFLLIYLTVPYYFLLTIKDIKWALYVFGIASSTDTMAYFVGITMGKHKLIERLSPKKTVEGSMGGILGGLIFTYVFVYIFKIEHSVLIYLFSIMASILSQVGDLVASFIKRKANIKDYGVIFIGHGGVMDRFDSILLITPIVYLLVLII